MGDLSIVYPEKWRKKGQITKSRFYNLSIPGSGGPDFGGSYGFSGRRNTGGHALIMGQTVSMKITMNEEVVNPLPGYEQKMIWTRYTNIIRL